MAKKDEKVTRIYKVTEKLTGVEKTRLVEAGSGAQAVRHVTAQAIQCKPLSVREALSFSGKVDVEVAANETDEEPATA